MKMVSVSGYFNGKLNDRYKGFEPAIKGLEEKYFLKWEGSRRIFKTEDGIFRETEDGLIEFLEPSFKLAVEAGVKDKSYQTVRHGLVWKFEGKAVVTTPDGKKWMAKGFQPKGDPGWVSQDGGIEFQEIQ